MSKILFGSGNYTQTIRNLLTKKTKYLDAPLFAQYRTKYRYTENRYFKALHKQHKALGVQSVILTRHELRGNQVNIFTFLLPFGLSYWRNSKYQSRISNLTMNTQI